MLSIKHLFGFESTSICLLMQKYKSLDAKVFFYKNKKKKSKNCYERVAEIMEWLIRRGLI